MKFQLFKILCVRFKCDYTLVTAVCVVQKFVNRIAVVCAEVNIAFVLTEIQNIAESLILVGCDRGEEVNSACVVEFQNIFVNLF